MTSTRLTCNPLERIIRESQLPARMAGAQSRIVEIEAPRPPAEEKPEIDYGPPKFTTQLAVRLSDGVRAHNTVERFLRLLNDPCLVSTRASRGSAGSSGSPGHAGGRSNAEDRMVPRRQPSEALEPNEGTGFGCRFLEGD